MPRTAPGGRQISSGGGVEMFLSSRSVWCDALTGLVLSRNQHTQASSLGFHIAALQPEDQAADGRLGSMIMTGHDGGRRKPATSRRSGGRGGRMGTRLMRRTPVRRHGWAAVAVGLHPIAVWGLMANIELKKNRSVKRSTLGMKVMMKITI